MTLVVPNTPANGTEYVNTTSPAAGKTGVAYSGSAYTVYNNTGSNTSYTIMQFKM